MNNSKISKKSIAILCAVFLIAANSFFPNTGRTSRDLNKIMWFMDYLPETVALEYAQKRIKNQSVLALESVDRQYQPFASFVSDFLIKCGREKSMSPSWIRTKQDRIIGPQQAEAIIFSGMDICYEDVEKHVVGNNSQAIRYLRWSVFQAFRQASDGPPSTDLNSYQYLAKVDDPYKGKLSLPPPECVQDLLKESIEASEQPFAFQKASFGISFLGLDLSIDGSKDILSITPRSCPEILF